jgi:PAS domain S-box-containing protein
MNSRSGLPRKVQLAFGTAVLALIVVGAIAYRSMVLSEESDHWVRHTHEVTENLQDLLYALKNVESSVRGFVLTGKESYVDTVRASSARTVQDQIVIARLTIDNPVQQHQLPELARLATHKIQRAEMVIVLRRAKGPAEAAEEIRTGPGQQLMVEFETVIRSMRDEELRLLVLRTTDSKRRVKESKAVLTMGTLLAVLITVGAGWTVRRDSAARDVAEANLALLTQRLSLAAAIAKVGVWDWDVASNISAWDATMFDIYGFPPVAALEYEKWAAAVHPEDLPPVEAMLQKTIAEKGQGAAEFRMIRADGSVRNISVADRVILDEHSNVIRVIGVNMDVTERRNAEKALEQNRKDEIRFKDEFLSHVSHELRSPLTAIKQFTTILLGGLAGELNKEQREYQQIVLKNIRQLQAMIDDLLEVTRMEAGKLSVELESVSLTDAITDTLNTLRVSANARKITLGSDVLPDLPAAHADQTRLRQILIILLDNAIKFTSGGGAIRVQVRLWSEDPRFLHVEVSDTGCGMSPEAAARIFERLYQVDEPTEASRKGLGLGLFICKELVTRQGGRIWVHSEPRVGSIFSFTLPVFSLTQSIAPLLKNDRWPAESVALIMVENCFVEAWPSQEAQDEWSREVRTLVQRCLMPNLDVLLPKMSYSADAERFFVAAFADEKGAAILANRIRDQFDDLLRPKRGGQSLAVSYTMLKPFPPDAGASMENIVTSMATKLEQTIKSQILAEAVNHES